MSAIVLKKSKKPPVDKSKDASMFPWVVRKPYLKDKFFKEWKQAQAAILSDLDALHDQWAKLLIADNVQLLEAVQKDVRESTAEQPIAIDAVIDTGSKTKYRAEVFKREAL